MTMNGALCPISAVHKLYVARGSGEKGVIGWEDCFRSKEWYVKNERVTIRFMDVGVTEKDDAESRFN